MNVVSFNIACMPKYMNIFGNITNRLEKIQLFLQDLNADIVLLQEVFSNYSRNILYNFFIKHNYNVIMSPSTKFYLNGGLLIATKHNIITTDYYNYKHYFGEDILAYKGILYAQISFKNKIIHLFNSHLNNPEPIFSIITKHYSYKLYKKQLKEFINYIYFIKKKYTKYQNNTNNTNNITYILGGDFNLKYNSKLYIWFIKKLKKTYTVCINKKKFMTDNKNNEQIDYIINCYNKNISYIPFSYTYISKNTYNSDHNALIKYIS